MSKRLYEDSNLSVAQFAGGIQRGPCYQITFLDGQDFTQYTQYRFCEMVDKLAELVAKIRAGTLEEALQ